MKSEYCYLLFYTTSLENIGSVGLVFYLYANYVSYKMIHKLLLRHAISVAARKSPSIMSGLNDIIHQNADVGCIYIYV